MTEERLRFVARRLEGEAMSDLCREFGISRKTGYKIFNRYKDHRHSIVAVTDELGAVVERLSFDPHGQRRAVDRQAVAGPIFPQETPRGFTGHEHLDGVELIHMNGRVYDPVLGRFLSADPIVQFSQSTQGFNRYTYTNNNPFSFIDPSGFFFGKIFKAAKSVFNGVAEAAKEVVKVAKTALNSPIVRVGLIVGAGALTAGWITAAYASFAQAAVLGSTAIGGPIAVGSTAAAASAAGAAAASSMGAAVLAGAASGFASGLIASGGDLTTAGIGALTGGAFGFVGASAALGPVGKITPQRIAANGLVGGTTTVLRGGKFQTGFASGAMAGLGGPLNHAVRDSGVLGRAITSAVVGGARSVIGGGKFINGAISGTFQNLLHVAGNGNSIRGALDIVGKI